MKIKLGFIIVASVFMSGLVFAADKSLNTEGKKISYTVGVQMARGLQAQGITDVDAKIMAMAIDDVLKGKKLKLSPEEMQQVIVAYQKKLAKLEAKKGQEAIDLGRKYQAKFGKKKGVVTLSNGIQYEVLKAGAGRQPTSVSTVIAHYEGSLLDGTVFDSSYQRGSPATFPLNKVIRGWTEIVPMMKIGAKWRVVIPSELAYGKRGAGDNIGPNQTLIFVIELIDIK